ncbi:MAG: glycosyltransferase family 2 protein [Acidobacteriales bacterium]|nr:glycosyltransferase family 2 protein [Terriglobales bacterium]
MKLVIQIPCYNEEQTLALTVSQLPRKLPGIGRIEYLVINDGSTDRTVEVARAAGVHHIVDLQSNGGLAKAFMAGIKASLRVGADIIVNTDADNQYCAADIGALIQPIVENRAEIVVGARPIEQIEHFSPIKKFLQKLGSWVVRLASRTEIPDAPSGFRAFSRQAAARINVFNDYTYTLETIIQAGQSGMTIKSVPIRTNADLRPSRLMKNSLQYVVRSMLTILRIFMTYRPLKFFSVVGSVPFFIGFLLGLRWVILFEGGRPASHIPSLILSALLIIIGVQLWIFGLIAELSRVNRILLEEVQMRMREEDVEPDYSRVIARAGSG